MYSAPKAIYPCFSFALCFRCWQYGKSSEGGERSWEVRVTEGGVGNGLGPLSCQVAQHPAQALRIFRRF